MSITKKQAISTTISEKRKKLKQQKASERESDFYLDASHFLVVYIGFGCNYLS
jgi:hypothetical protein